MTNPEKIKKFKDLIQAKLLDRVDKRLDVLITGIEKLKEAIAKKPEPHIHTHVPPSIAISNLYEVPTDVSIKNLPDIQKVHIVNLPEQKNEGIVKVEIVSDPQKDKVQEVHVINQQKTGEWMPSIIIAAVEGVSGFFAKLWKQGLTVKLDDSERMKPLPVIMVDVFGRPLGVPSPQQIVVPFSGGGSRTQLATAVGTGRVTLTNTNDVYRFTATPTPSRKVIVTAPGSNADAVYLGGASVSSTSGSEQGIMILPTGSATIEIDDVSKLYAAAVSGGSFITFMYMR